jgi:hypothetical protein
VASAGGGHAWSYVRLRKASEPKALCVDAKGAGQKRVLGDPHESSLVTEKATSRPQSLSWGSTTWVGGSARVSDAPDEVRANAPSSGRSWTCDDVFRGDDRLYRSCHSGSLAASAVTGRDRAATNALRRISSRHARLCDPFLLGPCEVAGESPAPGVGAFAVCQRPSLPEGRDGKSISSWAAAKSQPTARLPSIGRPDDRDRPANGRGRDLGLAKT